MKKARKHEIGYKLFKEWLLKDGISISKNTKRELGNIAKEIDVPVEELTEIYKEIVEEHLKKL